jgi:hypothetical protein
MVKDVFVENGWYRIVLITGERFIGKCSGIKGDTSTFDIGSDESETIDRIRILIIHKDDVKSSVRLSPRYIETIETNTKDGWTKYRYKGLFKYGEE